MRVFFLGAYERKQLLDANKFLPSGPLVVYAIGVRSTRSCGRKYFHRWPPLAFVCAVLGWEWRHEPSAASRRIGGSSVRM